jgi:hypothetical protein
VKRRGRNRRNNRNNLKQKEIASRMSVARNDREAETLIYQSQNILLDFLMKQCYSNFEFPQKEKEGQS